MNPIPPSEHTTRCPACMVRWIVFPLLWFTLASLTLWAVAALYFDVRIPWLRRSAGDHLRAGHAGRVGAGAPSVEGAPHCRWIPARAGLVALLETLQRPRLAAGCGGAALCGHRRQPGDDPQHPQLRLPHARRTSTCIITTGPSTSTPCARWICISSPGVRRTSRTPWSASASPTATTSASPSRPANRRAKIIRP